MALGFCGDCVEPGGSSPTRRSSRWRMNCDVVGKPNLDPDLLRRLFHRQSAMRQCFLNKESLAPHVRFVEGLFAIFSKTNAPPLRKNDFGPAVRKKNFGLRSWDCGRMWGVVAQRG